MCFDVGNAGACPLCRCIATSRIPPAMHSVATGWHAGGASLLGCWFVQPLSRGSALSGSPRVGLHFIDRFIYAADFLLSARMGTRSCNSRRGGVQNAAPAVARHASVPLTPTLWR